MPETALPEKHSDVLVTIPAHNEQHWLYETVSTLKKVLDNGNVDYRLSVAEDGSTDDTKVVLERLRSEYPDIIIQSHPERLGRGKALRTLWLNVDANHYVFIDADLAGDTTGLLEVIQKSKVGFDVVTGSRYVTGAVVNRPPARWLVSKAYNQLVRLVFSESVQDHQCGLKAFSRRARDELLPICREDSWAWDTEVLVLASHLGYGVVEIPVRWTERRTNKTPWKRLLSDLKIHATALLNLRGTLGQTVTECILLRYRNIHDRTDVEHSTHPNKSLLTNRAPSKNSLRNG